MDKSSWLEVSMVVDGELAEAVAEVLARYVSGGVVVESTRIEHPLGEGSGDGGTIGRPVGPLRVSGFLPVDEQLKALRSRLEEALWYLGRIRPLPEPEFKQVQSADWAEAWKKHFQPIPIGKRLLIAPGWAEIDPAHRRRVIVRIDPGMAFGTGTHPTTQLCLELLDEILDDRRQSDGRPMTEDGGIRLPSSVVRPPSLIDIGCGSGILAIAALMLGAPRALAVDTDPEAVAAARQNATANGVLDNLKIEQGSLAEIRAGSYGLQCVPLVVANILAPVIIRLLEDGLAELVSAGGLLMLSGLLQDQVGGVIAAAKVHGLHLVHERQAGDWAALVVAS